MDLMLDLETLSQGPTAAIIAIGAMKFNPLREPDIWGGSDYFFTTINPSRALDYGAADASTSDWWNRQDPQVRELMFSGTDTPPRAFESLCQFAKGCKHVWAKSPTFDCTIIRHLESCVEFVHLGQPVEVKFPFTFREERDVRTMIAIGQQLGVDVSSVKQKEFPKHHPLGDCILQVKQVQLVNEHLTRLSQRSLWSRLFGQGE